MTQKIRWLSALVLLLAVGAVAVRAEEEEAPPGRPYTVELLPAPLPVPVERPCVHVMPPVVVPAGVWSFMGSAQPPLPCPVPFIPAGFAPCGDGCGACPLCTYPNCPLCSAPQAPQGGEYVVEMKMIEAGDDEPDAVISHPRICVLEGQTGTVQTAAAGSKEQSTLQMQATLTKLDVGAILDLRVEQASSFTPGNNVLQSHTDTTEHRLPVLFGKATKLELTHDSNGACTSWVEVTVTKVETEARMPKTAAACPKAMVAEEEEDVESLGLSDFVEFLEDCFDAAAETASTVTGGSSGDEPTAATGEYLQHPPLYCPETSARATAVGTCPASGRSCCTPATCTQCAATEVAKKPSTHVRISVDHGCKSIEISQGDMHWKGSANCVKVHGGCIELEHCQFEASDGSTSFSADMKTLKLDNSDIEIEIGD